MKYLITFLASPVFARSLKASADKFAGDVKTIAISISLVGIIYVAIGFLSGAQDAFKRAMYVGLGIICLHADQGIMSFFKGIA